MRALLPQAVENPDLHAIYAEQWLDSGGVRANFVTSLDGAAAVDGSSRGLQTPGDRAVFTVLRDLADVVLVGRATAQAEGYRAMPVTPRRARIRARFGLPPQLPIAVVSAALDLDPTGPLFDYADGAARTLVITVAGQERPREIDTVADVVVAGAGPLDLPSALAQLRARGLRRILSEGGPQLFGALLAAHAVDELCLTTVPRLAGAGSGRMVAGPPVPTSAALISLLEDDGATFARYRLESAAESTGGRS